MSDNAAYNAAKGQITRAHGAVMEIVRLVHATSIPDAMLYDDAYPMLDAETVRISLLTMRTSIMGAFSKVYDQIEKAEKAVKNIRNANLHRSYYDDLVQHEKDWGSISWDRSTAMHWISCKEC